MARIFHVLGLVLGALILNLEAYEVVFSDDVTTDFTNGSIDVSGFVRQDWLYLPLVGFCGLAGKFTTPHHIDTSMARGTLYTTFEYLTLDCTAEYRRDINSCAVLTSVLQLPSRQEDEQPTVGLLLQLQFPSLLPLGGQHKRYNNTTAYNEPHNSPPEL